MRLIELEPRWLSDNVFAFRCPHCQKVWLTCKNVVMGNKEQCELVRLAGLEPNGAHSDVILMSAETCWSWILTTKDYFRPDFETISVTPSVDASKSGHWHGFITNGEIK